MGVKRYVTPAGFLAGNERFLREYEPYHSGKYQNNTDIQPSLLYRDFER